jgi:hypothetical protein
LCPPEFVMCGKYGGEEEEEDEEDQMEEVVEYL